MKSRTIAIAGSITALAVAAGPITAAAVAEPHHHAAVETRIDRSRDAKGVRSVDKSRDTSQYRAEHSRDFRDS